MAIIWFNAKTVASSTDTRSLCISLESASDKIGHNHYRPAVKSILSWEWASLKPWRSHKIIGFLSGGGPLIFYRHGWAISSPSSSSSLCHVPKNFSNQHIFAYSKGNSRISRFKRRVFNLFSRRALPTAHVRGPKLEWNQEHVQQCTRDQDLSLHVGKPVRESDTRFVLPWQAYSSFREFIPQFTARSSARVLPPPPRTRDVNFVGKQNVDKTT